VLTECLGTPGGSKKVGPNPVSSKKGKIHEPDATEVDNDPATMAAIEEENEDSDGAKSALGQQEESEYEGNNSARGDETFAPEDGFQPLVVEANFNPPPSRMFAIFCLFNRLQVHSATQLSDEEEPAGAETPGSPNVCSVSS